jgi:hypothetical protein
MSTTMSAVSESYFAIECLLLRRRGDVLATKLPDAAGRVDAPDIPPDGNRLLSEGRRCLA